MARQPTISAEWMRISEAADQLPCHHKTLYRRIQRGSLPDVRVLRLGNMVRIHRADWEAYLERNTVAQKKKAA